jgi:hypothetical protein
MAEVMSVLGKPIIKPLAGPCRVVADAGYGLATFQR